jgi:hypothetical protein
VIVGIAKKLADFLRCKMSLLGPAMSQFGLSQHSATEKQFGCLRIEADIGLDFMSTRPSN